MMDVMTLLILSIVSTLTLVSVAIGVAHRLKVISTPRLAPKVIQEPGYCPKLAKKPLWYNKGKQGVRFCSDMVWVDLAHPEHVDDARVKDSASGPGVGTLPFQGDNGITVVDLRGNFFPPETRIGFRETSI